ncbi:MAG: arsenate reductase ArsC [Bacteroidota bacterium]
MEKVIILCSHNSARSQMAEAYLKFYSSENLEIESAGIESKDINLYTVMAMQEDNIDISDQQSNSYKDYTNTKFDYLITVCDEALKKLPKDLKYKKHYHFSVPDPSAFTGDPNQTHEFFKSVRDTVKKEILKWIGQKVKNPFSDKGVAA